MIVGTCKICEGKLVYNEVVIEYLGEKYCEVCFREQEDAKK